ncbi:MAG: AbrB/MazE/SpoVT family DNA-binding domain-containing protein [Nitrosopumilaceae archaeon]|nr:phosphate uptake regulator PhoU [Nitrosopumilaceae archaeon]NIT99938.1 phosphate uptake regulator PhoU [Nitrosopumilaceae archaeon]NIU86292.1 AbrB/MazE/SpoVT family DNA-binding domain-containing protein [Nitrosopumilaceae archaeon]NIV65047.1 AbrB/MazE/SpoVT family DNA-binding domain-containing protein [Nitrosopumilaceae archaeon]NIX60541.1 AbrB/MazE/SpoVT family DNA-binding domain-containing protein [Nitrosopumilaceae archaeon]
MEDGEETRKIQFTGKSSYIVSLPKQWVADLGLKQGDQIRMSRQGSSMLQIYPTKYKSKSPKIEDATIEIDAEDSAETVVRKLISLYFLGFKTINVKPKIGRLKPNQRTAIKESVKRMLMGSEIISDSTSEITIQVLVNLLELSVDGAFKRMIHLAKSMLYDAILSVKEMNFELAKEIINTDDEVDRFGFYIIRQLKIAIQNEHMLKEMGFRNARDCLGYRLVVKNIERTGDHAVFIAQDLLEFKREIKKDILTKIQAMNDFAISVLDDSCLALFKEDYIQAEKTITRISEIENLERKIREATKSLKDQNDIHRIRRMTENIRRIAEYASDIAEIVLNMNIEKALKKR